MKVRFTVEANANIAAIARFLGSKRISGLTNVRADIRTAIVRIAEHPRSGKAQADADVRKAVTRRYGYIIYYTIVSEDDAIDILSVHHPARERPFNEE